MMNDEPHYEMYTIAAIRRKAHICENEKKKKQDGLTEASKCLKKMKESSTLHILTYLEWILLHLIT